MRSQSQTIVYGFLFFGIVLGSILAIVVTNKTLPVSKNISRVNAEIAKVKEENQQLLYQISEATSHSELLKKAKHYKMKPSRLNDYTHLRLKGNHAK